MPTVARVGFGPPEWDVVYAERNDCAGLLFIAGHRCDLYLKEDRLGWRVGVMHWRNNHINSAVIACLEHVATSTAPPGAGAADFLLRLLDERVFSIEEVDAIAAKVSFIISGIVDRAHLSRPTTATVPADELGLSATR